MKVKYPDVPNRYGILLDTFKSKQNISNDELIQEIDSETKSNKIYDEFHQKGEKIPSRFEEWKNGKRRVKDPDRRLAIMRLLKCDYMDTFFPDYDKFADCNIKDGPRREDQGENILDYINKIRETARVVLEQIVAPDNIQNLEIRQINSLMINHFQKSTSSIGMLSDLVTSLIKLDIYRKLNVGYLIWLSNPNVKDELEQAITLNNIFRSRAKIKWWDQQTPDGQRKELLINKQSNELIELLTQRLKKYFENLIELIGKASNSYAWNVEEQSEYVKNLTYKELYIQVSNGVNSRYDEADDKKMLFEVITSVLIEAVNQQVELYKQSYQYDPEKRVIKYKDFDVLLMENVSDDFLTEGLDFDINKLL